MILHALDSVGGRTQAVAIGAGSDSNFERHASAQSLRGTRDRYLNRHRGSASRANASSAVIASAP
jgi:hypothetical protein